MAIEGGEIATFEVNKPPGPSCRALMALPSTSTIFFSALVLACLPVILRRVHDSASTALPRPPRAWTGQVLDEADQLLQMDQQKTLGEIYKRLPQHGVGDLRLQV